MPQRIHLDAEKLSLRYATLGGPAKVAQIADKSYSWAHYILDKASRGDGFTPRTAGEIARILDMQLEDLMTKKAA